jgi:Tol biopolymer transport system component
LRPPDGSEILFVAGSSSRIGLYAIGSDGTGRRTIIDSATAGPTIASLETPQWSPDGAMIAVAVSAVGEGDHRKLWIVDSDGTQLRPLTRGSGARDEGHLQWSPDGTKVAFMRWLDWPDGSGGSNVRPITVVDIASGDEIEVGDVSLNGFNGWTWSPDGRSILQIPSESGHVIVLPIDPAARPQEFPDWTSPGAPSWQRVAP